jgi:hypothetical protein
MILLVTTGRLACCCCAASSAWEVPGRYNIPAGQTAALVEGTGWQIEQHLHDGHDHAVVLRRS